MQAPIAQAAPQISWNPLPLACLPERAQKWTDGQPESGQQPCHCPPTSMCPTSYEAYKNNALAQMPWMFVAKCCPVITNPTPPTCPDGSTPDASGNCPVASNCPTKHYETLVDSGLADNSGRFSGTWHGQQFVGMGAFQDNQPLSNPDTRVGRLPNDYEFSLRIWDLSDWVWGTWGCTHGMSCALTGMHGHPGGYEQYTDNINRGNSTLQQLFNQLHPASAAWFGVSLARIDALPDNLVNPTVLANINSQHLDFVRVADNDWSGGPDRSGDLSDTVGLATTQPDFVNACRSVAGEYVTVENHTMRDANNNPVSCPYLQCRYIYDSGMESCLAAGTKITLPDGTGAPIESLKLGDMVKGTDGQAHKVSALNVYQSSLRVLYGINGAGPTLTGDHPIKTEDGWKVIADDAAALVADKPGFAKRPLAVGDVIVTEKGTVKVTDIHRFAVIKPVATYNLRVKDEDSFYADGMAVKGFDHMEMHY
ncbi:MAG: Hint domain-containing protein [Alphaproteobacteria bacterium]